MEETALRDAVLSELRVLRKDAAGVTVQSLARASTICGLLGSGDPTVAYTRLQHALLDATLDRTVRAAAASLGFASSGATHLDRLVEAGEALEREQRQVRRLSDRGLVTLARFIASNWAVESVPRLTAVVVASKASYEIHITTIRPLIVEMSKPTIEILIGEERSNRQGDWSLRDDLRNERAVLTRPVVVVRTQRETSAVVVWRGELWPKFTTLWQGDHANAGSETLGNKLLLRLRISS